MFWNIILKTSLVVSLISAVKQIIDKNQYEISPTRIYDVYEASRFLGIKKEKVLDLIESGEIKIKKANSGENKKILGQSIIDYMGKQ